MRTVISLTVGLLLVSVTSLSAQQAPPVEVGSRVRVTAIDLGLEKQSASLQGLRGDTLDLFVVQGGGSIVSVPLASVTEFATLQSTSRRTVTGALIGSAVGFSAGVIVLAAAHEGCEGGGFFSWGRRYLGLHPQRRNSQLSPVHSWEQESERSSATSSKPTDGKKSRSTDCA